jgi:sec-independent protein translocase protein TatB
MFDVGVSELGVIGLVALIVIGPEQLPRVARTAGHLMGRLRRYVSDVKSDISREMDLADLKRMSDEVKDSARSMESSIREQMTNLESEVQQSIAPLESHRLVDEPVAQVSAAHEAPPVQAGLPVEDSRNVQETPPLAAEPSADNPVDPNQMDLFGASPAAVSSQPEKH